MKLLLHAVEYASRANGPGLRAVVWFQGCTLGCSGCFNPATHSTDGGSVVDTADIATSVLAHRRRIEGVTISGGEPLQQPEALLDLLRRVEGSGLSALVFSGYTRTEIERQPLGLTILQHLDVLIAGRYLRSRHVGRGLLGSGNQTVHLLSDRYAVTDFEAIPKLDIILHNDGTISVTGIDPPRFSTS